MTALESVADFPCEMEDLRRAMEGATNYNRLRQQLAVDMADCSQRRDARGFHDESATSPVETSCDEVFVPLEAREL